jgi:glucose/arabinose dehydrogenase
VTEKNGRLRILDQNWKLQPEAVSDTPPVVVSSQGGLLDVAPAPDFEKSGWIYLSYSAPAPGDSKIAMTKISRGRIADNKWIDEETIFEADPKHYTKSGVHFRSRACIFFDRRARG